jgi:membrane-associated phospholipid phosphatase
LNPVLRATLVAVALALAVALSQRRAPPSRPPPLFWGLGTSLWAWLTGAGGWLALSAVLLTVLLVLGGGDRALQDLFQRADPLGPHVPRALLRGGELWTAIVALVLVLARWTLRRAPWHLASAAAVQAVSAGLLVTLTLKLLTGRRGPARPGQVAPFPKVEDAGDFAFDLWNRVEGDGRFFWPSGHTLSSVVLVSALAAAFPRARWIARIGIPLALFMGLAMIDGDFHWTSDVVAALLLGAPLGYVVGARLAAAHARGPASGSGPDVGG